MNPDKAVLVNLTSKEIVFSTNSMEDLAKVIAGEVEAQPTVTFAIYSLYAVANKPTLE